MDSDRILIVEDNPVNQKVAQLMLKRLGYTCTISENGADAIERMKSERFLMVLMDARMPVMDGVAATKWVRDHFAEEDQPIIAAMTASLPEESKEILEGARFDGYISKPVSLDTLKAGIEKILKDKELEKCV